MRYSFPLSNLVMCARLIPPRRAIDPSPGPRRVAQSEALRFGNLRHVAGAVRAPIMLP